MMILNKDKSCKYRYNKKLQKCTWKLKDKSLTIKTATAGSFDYTLNKVTKRRVFFQHPYFPGDLIYERNR